MQRKDLVGAVDDSIVGLADKELLDTCSPTAVVINADHEVVRCYGETTRYIQSPAGQPDRSIIKLARSDLRSSLRAILGRAAIEPGPVVSDVKLHSDDWPEHVRLRVRPVRDSNRPSGFLLVIFEPGYRESDLLSLNADLRHSNRQFQHEIDRLTQRADDIRNMVEGSRIATLFLDQDLMISRFTPGCAELLDLSESDAGRPLSEIAVRCGLTRLPSDCAYALSSLAVQEHEATTADGRSLVILALPYETHRSTIDGVVVTFADVTSLRRAEGELDLSSERYRLLLEATHVVVWEADPATFQFTYVSPFARNLLGYSVEQWLEPGFWQERLHPIDREKAASFCLAASERREDHECEYRMVAADGRTVWIKDIVTASGGMLRGVFVDITNLRLFLSLQDARQGVLEALAQDTPLPEALRIIIDACEANRPEMVASILLLDGENKTLHLGAAPSLPEFYNNAVEGLSIGPEVGSCGAAACLGERVIVEDIQTHPNWRNFRDLATRANVGACWSEPIRSSSGAVLGTFALDHHAPKTPSAYDIRYIEEAAHLAANTIERTQTLGALSASETRFRALINHTPIAIHEIGLDKRILSMNPFGLRMFKVQSESEIRGKPFLEFVAPPEAGNIGESLDNVLGGCHIETEFGAIIDDRRRVLASSFVPVIDDDGTVLRIIGLSQDVTHRRREEERRRLIIQELDHRVKNTLATVQAISERTLFASETLEQFDGSFRGRIASLASVHEVLARQGWQGAKLQDLIETAIAPYSQGRDRVDLRGEDTLVSVRTVLPLCMTLHELATNAAKYGSFSSTNGRIEISWSKDDETGQAGERSRTLALSWRESGGPPVTEPVYRGVGTSIVERAIGYELGGEARLHFDSEGLHCVIRLPLVD